jgi:hypothetical protein
MNALKEVTYQDPRAADPADPELFQPAEIGTPIWSLDRARLSADRLISRCRDRLPALASISLALDRLAARQCEIDDYQLLRQVAHAKIASWKIERLFLITQLIHTQEQAAVAHKPKEAGTLMDASLAAQSRAAAVVRTRGHYVQMIACIVKRILAGDQCLIQLSENLTPAAFDLVCDQIDQQDNNLDDVIKGLWDFEDENEDENDSGVP